MDDWKVLLVGRSGTIAESIRPKLSGLLPGFQVQIVSNPQDALPELTAGRVFACVAFMEEASEESQVVALLHAIQGKRLSIPTFVVNRRDDVYQRLRFFEWGVVDCLPWPVDLTHLATLIDVLSVRQRIGTAAPPMRAEKAAMPTIANNSPTSSQDAETSRRVVAGFMFASRAMRELYDQIGAAADSDTHVLLTGETGTGKSHVSKAIHSLSPRTQRPFVVIECGGLSPTLLESELFGHVRGAFTGADRDHVGKFAVVEDGTILLDEIDCVPLEAQAKLLRVLEDRLYEPVGANRTAKFRARVIAATNRPLEQLVAEGRFRSDLFFRLNVLEFCLPPLRDCREAIGPLTENFLKHSQQRADRPIEGITHPALEAMLAYDWPGNIRELRNCIQRAVTLCRNHALDVADLPETIRKAAQRSGHNARENFREPTQNRLQSARDHGERHQILAALAKHNNNRTQTANELGISRVALYKRLRKHGLMNEPH